MRYFIAADARTVSTKLRKAGFKASGAARRAYVGVGFKVTSAYSSNCEVTFQGFYDQPETHNARLEAMAQALRDAGYLVEITEPGMGPWRRIYVWSEAKDDAQMHRFWANPHAAKVVTDGGTEMSAMAEPSIKREHKRRERAANARERAAEALHRERSMRMALAVRNLRDMGFNAQEDGRYGQYRVTITLEDAEALVTKLQ